MEDQDLIVTGSSGCVECVNPNETIGFSDLEPVEKSYWNNAWYWTFAAPRCFYAPYYPQGDFTAIVSLRCDSETNSWTLYVQAQAMLAYVDIPGCDNQMATCYYGWEGAVSVAVDQDGKFQGVFTALLPSSESGLEVSISVTCTPMVCAESARGGNLR